MAMSPYLRVLRAKVGHSRVLVPSVAAIIRAEGHRILLVQQHDYGRWTTPGGAVEPEETPADAVVREVLEETGLVVVPTRIAGVYGGPDFVVQYPNGDETQYISTMFECEVKSGSLGASYDNDNNDEVSAAAYWTLDEARALPLSPWLHRVLPRLYETHAAAWF